MIHTMPQPAVPGTDARHRQAVEWLRHHAAVEPAWLDVRGGRVRVAAGEIVTTMRRLATAWSMTPKAAWRLVCDLSREGVVETVTETQYTRIILRDFNGLTQGAVSAGNANGNATDQIPDMRKSVASVPDLVAWCKASRPGDYVTYHMGNLAQDRALTSALHELAEMVLILAERDYLRMEQVRTKLAALVGYSYIAIKTGRGGVVPSIMEQRVTPVHYRALQALGARHGVQSAQRCLRDGMGLSEEGASAMLRALEAKGLIEPSPSRGMTVTRKGLSMVL